MRGALLTSAVSVAALVAGPAWAQQKTFNVPAQAATTGIPVFARQAGVQILVAESAVRGRRTQAVTGAQTLQSGLAQLLAGTELVIGSNDGRTVTLQPRPQDVAAAASAGPEVLDELLVTGSRIRGASPTAPVNIVTRVDIERSGFGQIDDVIRSLPENFGGGQNPGNIGVAAANANITNGANVNLRGLGPSATLVLLNGRRLAADAFYQAPDISGIPLGAISRVEIVTDGSSAIYGSDAVAGVANFILRKDFDGVEVGARLGGATQGGGLEQTYSALAGVARPGGFAMLNVEYAKRDNILASERDITSNAPPNVDIWRPQERKSVFLSAGRDLTDRVSFSVDALWSDREVEYLQQTRRTGSAFQVDTETSSYFVSGALDVKLPKAWVMRVNASTSRGLTDSLALGVGVSSRNRYRNETQSGEVVFDGPLFRLSTGEVRVAVGGGWREERFSNKAAAIPQFASHEVRSLFGEAFFPLVAPSERSGLRELDLSLSARYEDYSDFGSASIPKVGFRYVPLEGVTVRGTWGKSFKAPAFSEQIGSRTAQIAPARNFGFVGPGNAILSQGGNPDLRPERSKSWTFGLEYTPASSPSMRLAATYFNIDYTDRVVRPVAPTSAAFSNPAFASFIIRDPSAATQTALLADVNTILNQTGAPFDPNTVIAIVSNRFANATSQTAEGVDVSYRQSFKAPLGVLNPSVSATWIRIRQQTLPTVVELTISDTIYNVPELRLRAGLSWDVGDFSANGFLNYQSGSIDTGVTPNRRIGSWTTVDANVAYRSPASTGPLAGVVMSVSATNLLNRDPPFAASPALLLHDGVFFDSTNASAVGRFVAVSLRKRF